MAILTPSALADDSFNKCDNNYKNISDIPKLISLDITEGLYEEAVDYYDKYYVHLENGNDYKKFKHNHFKKSISGFIKKFSDSNFALPPYDLDHSKKIHNLFIRYFTKLINKKNITMKDYMKAISIVKSQAEISQDFYGRGSDLTTSASELLGPYTGHSIFTEFEEGRLIFTPEMDDSVDVTVGDFVNLSIFPLFTVPILDDRSSFSAHKEVGFRGLSSFLNHDLQHLGWMQTMWNGTKLSYIKDQIQKTYRCTCQLIERTTPLMKKKIASIIFEMNHETNNPILLDSKEKIILAIAAHIKNIKSNTFLDPLIVERKKLNGKTPESLPEYIELTRILTQVRSDCSSKHKSDEKEQIDTSSVLQSSDCSTESDRLERPISNPLVLYQNVNNIVATMVLKKTLNFYNGLNQEQKEQVFNQAFSAALLTSSLLNARNLYAIFKKVKYIKKLKSLTPIGLVGSALFGSVSYADLPENIDYYTTPEGFSKIGSKGFHRLALSRHPPLNDIVRELYKISQSKD